MSSPTTMHVLVLGCGPSGAALAESCASRGLRTMIVDQEPDAEWTARYGVWVDEWPAELRTFAHRFEAATVVARTEHTVHRGYGIVDRESVRRALRSRFIAQGGELLRGRVATVTSDRGAARVTLDDGRVLEASVVVDARGAGAPIDPGPLWQSAWGAEIEAALPLEPDRMHLMDFSAASRSPEPPSFLYAYALGEGRWFVEETVLVGAKIPLELLRERLARRLEHWGVDRQAVERGVAVEECRIPMLPGPYPYQPRVVPFGVAAGYVHPATGYSVATSMQRRERLADAIADATREAGATGAALRDAVETAKERSARSLHAFGAHIASTFDQTSQQAFFEAFFRSEPGLRDAYLGTQATPARVGRAMWSVFWRTSPELRGILTRAGLERAGQLGRALLGRTRPALPPATT